MKSETARSLAEKLLGYPEQQWNELISEWCGKNVELKKRVTQLAENNRTARDFVEELQNRIYSLTKSSLKTGIDQPGYIAGYNIIRKIGSGGSASVFLIEKEDGEKFALKILRGIFTDSASRQRFHLEQQILAALQHPNIARMIEAGITDMGEPFVIMEFVDGIPIDKWCSQNRLDLNERIRLFQGVCRAVHYAHQNLVVHRDIKPEHVLITKTGEIKLIDFGIAKLLEPSKPENNVFQTRTGMHLMTPEFASPEQVRGEPVTTSSDIYSLGVLFYLIICGRRPYTFNTSSMLEIERMVCEQEPLKPSDALSGSEGSYSLISPDHIPGLKIRKRLTGDLDRITLMAMRKEPSKRYASALGFAHDLDKYLRGEPVVARAPTFRYRAQKFITRNKWTVTAAAFALLALTTGLFGTLWQARQAELNSERAESQAQLAGQITDFLVDLFESGDPSVTQGQEITIEELLERGVKQALAPGQDSSVQLNLFSVLGRVYSSMGIYSKSTELFTRALNIADNQTPSDPLMIADLQNSLALNFRKMGNLATADSLYHQAFHNRRTVLGDDHPATIQSMDEWAGVHAYLSRDADLADSLFQDVVHRRKNVLKSYDKELAESLNNLAYIKTLKGDYNQALRHYEESAEIYREVLGEHHPDRLRAMSGMAIAYHRTGNYGRSEQMYTNLIEIRKQVLGLNHPQVAISCYHLAELLKDTGRIDQALLTIQESVDIMQNLEAPHQFFPDILLSKSVLLIESGRPEAAAEAYHQTAQKCMEIRGKYSPGCLKILQAAGEYFLSHKKNNEARIYLELAYDGVSQRENPDQEQLVNLRSLIKLTE